MIVPRAKSTQCEQTGQAPHREVNVANVFPFGICQMQECNLRTCPTLAGYFSMIASKNSLNYVRYSTCVDPFKQAALEVLSSSPKILKLVYLNVCQKGQHHKEYACAKTNNLLSEPNSLRLVGLFSVHSTTEYDECVGFPQKHTRTHYTVVEKLGLFRMEQQVGEQSEKEKKEPKEVSEFLFGVFVGVLVASVPIKGEF